MSGAPLPGHDPAGLPAERASRAAHAADRFTGALLGLACGDALGAPIEFLAAAEVQARHGRLSEMVGGGGFGWAPGEWTDDTAQALAVARGILADPDDPIEPIGRGFLAWADAGAKDIGTTTRGAFDAYRRTGDWHRGAREMPAARAGRAAGNGSLMRNLPAALADPDSPSLLASTARISAMTHWDPMAETCCAVHALWVRAILRGAAPLAAWTAALDSVRSHARDAQLGFELPGLIAADHPAWTRLERVPAAAAGDLQPTGYAGYSLDCLEAAAWCVLRTSSYEEAMVTAVNLGGETDTIAAVAGGAAGAFYGLPAVPARWLEVLKDREALLAVAEELLRLRHRRTYSESRLQSRPFVPRPIDDRLLVGRNPLTAVDVGELAAAGVTAVIDLREEHEWREPWHGAEALATYPLVGIERLHLPTPDATPPAKQTFDRACAFAVEHARGAGAGKVFVHCRAGVERTGAVLVALHALERGLAAPQALAEIRQRAPSIAPLREQLAAVDAWLAER